LSEKASKANLREAKDALGRNALHVAAGKGHLEVCRFLVEESGLDVNSTASGSAFESCASGAVPACQCHWRHSSLVVVGGTLVHLAAVHLAAVGGHERVLEYLLDRDVDPGVPDANGSMPLHHAAEQGHCEAVRLLLSKGVDVDPVNHLGTSLHLAAAKDRDQVVKILLEHGADPNKVVNHVYSPLMMACCGHSLKCMQLLVQAGAGVNFISPSGPSILMEAVDNGLTDIVKFLLEAGADPNIADEDGKIPIMSAAVQGHRELVEILLPKTRPIPYVPDWSVDGIIRSMKYLRFVVQVSK